jgi:hypothetical protein
MNRSFAFAVPVALALSFGATGCTIYTYSETPNSKKPGKTKAAGTTTTKPAGRVPRRPGTAAGGTTTAEIPTVQGKTIFGGGAVAAFHGYAYVIPEGTTKVPNFDDLVPFAQLYTDQFDVAPQTFAGGFPGALLQDEWFAIRYTGKIMAPVAATWNLKLISDDGAVVYIDGKRVLENDGVHTPRTNLADVTLAAGEHALRLDYFQEKKGGVALQLYAVVGGRDVPITGIR